MNNTELAWAAGFLEGEGSFTFGGRHKSRSPWSGSPQAGASQKTREPLDRLCQLFGGNLSSSSIKRGGSVYPYWAWRVYGERAIGVMYAMYPFMSARRRIQIRNTILAWRHAPFTLHRCRRNHDLSRPGARYVRPSGKPAGCYECRRLYSLSRSQRKAI